VDNIKMDLKEVEIKMDLKEVEWEGMD